MPYQDIASSGPLTHVYLGADASQQVAHEGDVDFEFYGPDEIPGDAGTFVVVGDALYAPDFANHDYTATSGLGDYTAFTLVSQSPVQGSGTVGDPYTVVTVVDVGTTGLHITQTDSYIVGEELYRTDMSISNSGTAGTSAILYRAGDCYLQGSDFGYGWYQASSGGIACSINANNDPPGRIEQFLPLTAGSHYYEAGYSEVWSWIGSHQAFPDSCRCQDNIDNGAGLSWNITVPAGGQVTVSQLTLFSPLGTLPLVTTKTADESSTRRGHQNGYTITLTNPNATAATVDTIVDDLPDAFTYVAGSTTGVTTTDPAISGQTLTWTGPFNVPANGSVTLHFLILVGLDPGTYYNNATATATGWSVVPTGNTAPIEVEPPLSVSVSSFDAATPASNYLLLVALAAALATLAFVTLRRRLR